MEFIPTIEYAEFGNIKPVNAGASVKRLQMRPKSVQMKTHRKVLNLMDISGGRIEILKTDCSEDNLLSFRNMEIKYMNDRTSIAWEKHRISNIHNKSLKEKEAEEFDKRLHKYTQADYSRAIL